MLKTCPHCGKIFSTEYLSKIYCCKKCANEARFSRDESFYDFPHSPDQEPLFSFECAQCGKTVHVYSKYDQRSRFCCGICASAYKRVTEAKRLARHPRTSNLGMSGGMSLESLIRRESRSVDKDDAVEIRKCPVCEKVFEVRRPNQRFCGGACYTKFHHSKKLQERELYG